MFPTLFPSFYPNSLINQENIMISRRDGAAEKTRTSTGVTPQRPQRCASTNSATAARSLLRVSECLAPSVGERWYSQHLPTAQDPINRIFTISDKKNNLSTLSLKRRPFPSPFIASGYFARTRYGYKILLSHIFIQKPASTCQRYILKASH